MELDLVKSEEMSAEEDLVTTIDEFEVSRDIQSTLECAFELAIGALETEGYANFLSAHPRYGRKVTHLVKGNTVIVADYRGANLLTLEVLPKNEAETIVRNLGKSAGNKEKNVGR